MLYTAVGLPFRKAVYADLNVQQPPFTLQYAINTQCDLPQKIMFKPVVPMFLHEVLVISGCI